jgi:hypothetical protein
MNIVCDKTKREVELKFIFPVDWISSVVEELKTQLIYILLFINFGFNKTKFILL